MIEPSLSEESIFLQAVEIPSLAGRAAYLDRACGEDPRLRAAVEALLRAHDQSGNILDLPEKSLPTVEEAVAERPGTLLGPYKLIEPIGEGGMGTVWMAQQTDPVKRLVALKLIKAGLDSKHVIARFEAERQALALMDHPNIARVLDGGTTSAGRPYFVMDLVKGVPITKHCDEHHLTPRQRLELFVQVCQAVQHAHQKGIIHRDLKPSNVLVALYDGKPIPKVIDFGVAKAAGQSLTDKTLVTGFGAIVGTLEYMSPEQAEINQLDIDTRSDVYALGVLLYELLAGSPPFTRKELTEGGMLEMLRVIREQEPTRPSTKLSTAEGLPTLAANRGTEPAKLTRLVRGELDWIVMKALEKDRNRRYESANGFAMDVRRYLADESVLACPPSAWYRFHKFARRNKRSLATATLLGLMLLVVAGLFGWMARDRAARRGRTAEAVTALLDQCEDALRADRADRAAVALEAAERRAAEGGAEELAGRLAHYGADLRLLRALDANDTFYWTWSSAAAFSPASGRFPDRKASAARWRDTLAAYGITPGEGSAAESAAKVTGSLVKDRVLTALDLWLVTDSSAEARAGVRAVLQAADADEYRDAVRDTMAAWDARAGAALVGRPEALNQPARYAVVLGRLPGIPDDRRRAVLESALQDRPGNLGLLMALGASYPNRQAEGSAERVRWFQAALAARPENVAARNDLGLALQDNGRLDAAMACYREVIRLDPQFALAHNNLGFGLQLKGDVDGAIAAYWDAIRADATLGLAHTNLGYALNQKGDPDGAIAQYKEAIRLDPKDAVAHNNLGEILRCVKRDHDGAISHFKEAIRINPKLTATYFNLRLALEAKGDKEAAAAEYGMAVKEAAVAFVDAGKHGEAVRLLEQVIGADPLGFASALDRLAKAYQAAGKLPDAIRLYEEGKRALEKRFGTDSHLTLAVTNNLAVAYWSAKRLDRSIPLFEEVLKRKVVKLGRDDPETLVTMANLGVNYNDAGRFDEAVPLLEEAYRKGRGNAALAWFGPALADAYVHAGKTDKAAALLGDVLADARKRVPAGSEQLAGELATAASQLVKLKKYAEAEPLLRESLQIREKKTPDAWKTFNTQSLLGEAYLGQNKHADAEPLLLQGYQGMTKRAAQLPPIGTWRLTAAAERLVRLYEATQRKDEAAKWRQEVEVNRQAEKKDMK